MGDVLCGVCREPWDFYSVIEAACGRSSDLVDEGEDGPELAWKFKRGEGCPACRWGEGCPECGGEGLDRSGCGSGSCPACKGYGSMSGYRMRAGREWGPWLVRWSSPSLPIPSGSRMIGKPKRELGRSYANAPAELAEVVRWRCGCGCVPDCPGCGGAGTRSAWAEFNGKAEAEVRERGEIRRAVTDLLGDDEDGIQVTLEDAGL